MCNEISCLHKKIYGLLLISIVLTGVLVLEGCGGETPAVDDKHEVTVNIGTQQLVNDEMLAIIRGYFKEEMDAEVNIISFEAGDIRNAMIAGDIDFAMLGSSSAVLGVANGMDVKLIWIHEIIGTAEQLVSREGSGIYTISDSKGKRIATPFTSTSHYSLLKALKWYGIDDKDVILLDMQMPDIYAAWIRNDIDAAYGWEPVVSKLLKSGKTVLTSEDLAEKGIITADVEIVRSAFAKEHPDIVEAYIRAVNRATSDYLKDPESVYQDFAEHLDIDKNESEKQVSGFIWLPVEVQNDKQYLGTTSQKGDFVKTVEETAEFLYGQGSLVEKPDDLKMEAFIEPKYSEAVANQMD